MKFENEQKQKLFFHSNSLKPGSNHCMLNKIVQPIRQADTIIEQNLCSCWYWLFFYVIEPLLDGSRKLYKLRSTMINQKTLNVECKLD